MSNGASVAGANPKLGQLLVEMGLVSGEQLETALDLQRSDGRRLGELLVDLGVINESRLVKALSRQLGIDICDPITAPVHEVVRSRISPSLAHGLRVVPIALKPSVQGETLFVATADPLRDDARAQLEMEAQLPIQWLLAGETEIDLALARHYGTQPPSFVLDSMDPPPPASQPPPPRRPSATPAAREHSSPPPSGIDDEVVIDDPVELAELPDLSAALMPLSEPPPPRLESVPVPSEPSLSMRRLGNEKELEVGRPPRISDDASWGDLVMGGVESAEEELVTQLDLSQGQRISELRELRRRSSLSGVDPVAIESEPPEISSRELHGSLAPPPVSEARSDSEAAAPPEAVAPPEMAEPLGDPLAGPIDARPSDAPLISRFSSEPPSSPPVPSSPVPSSPVPSSPASGPPASPRELASDLTGDEVDNIVGVLNQAVDNESVDLMDTPPSVPPAPSAPAGLSGIQPTVSQEIKLMSGQIRAELADFIRGEASDEASFRVLRVVAAVLKEQGMFEGREFNALVERLFYSEGD